MVFLPSSRLSQPDHWEYLRHIPLYCSTAQNTQSLLFFQGNRITRTRLNATFRCTFRVVMECVYCAVRTEYLCIIKNPQRRGTARTLPNFCVVLCTVCFVSFSVLFVCICVLNYCHWVVTQLQLNISYHMKGWHFAVCCYTYPLISSPLYMLQTAISVNLCKTSQMF